MTKASLYFLASSNLCKLQQNLYCAVLGNAHMLGIDNCFRRFTYSNPLPPPQARRSALTSLTPRRNTLSQGRKFVRRMLKMSFSR